MSTQIVVVNSDRIELSVDSRFRFWDAIEVATRANVMLRDALSDGAGYEIEIVYDEDLQRFVAESITVTRATPGTEITARLIRELTVQEVIAEVALSEMTMLWYSDEGGPAGKITGSDALARILPAEGRDPGEVMDDALLISVLAKLGNWPPLVTVADRLGVSHSTAKRLVARAKARNLEFFERAQTPAHFESERSTDG